MLLGKLIALKLANGLVLYPGKELPSALVDVGRPFFIAAMSWVDGVDHEPPHWEINCLSPTFATLYNDHQNNLDLLQRALDLLANLWQLSGTEEEKKQALLKLREVAYKGLDEKETGELHVLIQKIQSSREELAKEGSQSLSIQLHESQVAMAVRQMPVSDMSQLLLLRNAQESITVAEEEEEEAEAEAAKPES